MFNKCSKCGTMLRSDEKCRERFELCLRKDYEHPSSYGTVHHLIVASYMLQHNEYSREGWLEARNLLVQAIRQGISPSILRQQNHQKFDSYHRQWNFTKGEKIAAIDKIEWSRTIADVRLDTPEMYCTDAKNWAKSILTDTESILKEL